MTRTSLAVVALLTVGSVGVALQAAPEKSIEQATILAVAGAEDVTTITRPELPVQALSDRGAPIMEPEGITLDEYEKPERCPQFIDEFRKYGLEPVDTFSFIAWRETRCNPDLINATFDSNGNPIKTLNRDGSYDVGLLQINSTWKTVTHEVCGTPWGDMFALLKLDCNLKVAKYLLDNGGLGHWSL